MPVWTLRRREQLLILVKKRIMIRWKFSHLRGHCTDDFTPHHHNNNNYHQHIAGRKFQVTSRRHLPCWCPNRRGSEDVKLLGMCSERRDIRRTNALDSLCQVVATACSVWCVLRSHSFSLTQPPYRKVCFCTFARKKIPPYGISLSNFWKTFKSLFKFKQ